VPLHPAFAAFSPRPTPSQRLLHSSAILRICPYSARYSASRTPPLDTTETKKARTRYGENEPIGTHRGPEVEPAGLGIGWGPVEQLRLYVKLEIAPCCIDGQSD